MAKRGIKPLWVRRFGDELKLAVLQKADWFLVDGQHDTTIIADHLVAAAGRIDRQSSRVEYPIFVPLRAGENQYMLVSGVLMERHLSPLAISKEGSRWSANPVSVQAKDFYTFLVGFPCDLILVRGKVKHVIQFEWDHSGRRL